MARSSPKTITSFSSKVIDAQVTFETDAQGRAMRLILHQNGDHPGKRIK